MTEPTTPPPNPNVPAPAATAPAPVPAEPTAPGPATTGLPTAPPPNPTAALEVDHVSRWYGNVVAVNDISFALGAGVTGLLGPNGAGKSTLLHLMAGLLAPSAGRVLVGGQTAWRRPEMYRHVGLVPEREAVHPYLTGLGFARLNAQLQGVADPDAAAARAIATVDLTEAADRPIGTYSKGMRQRAKLAGALVHDPTVLLLDEPFNGLDPRQRLHMMALLRSMAAQGRTILFSSHILEEVERVADSVLVVYAGRLAAAGDFRSIRRLMTDRPHTFTVSSSDDRRLASALLGRSVGLRRRARRRPSGDPDGRLRRVHARAAEGRPRQRGDPLRGRPDRRLARERLQLPGPPMSVMVALIDVTLRGLLSRRRAILLVLLASLPVLIGLLVRVSGGRPDADRVLDTLVVRTVMPLVALIIGTSALGSEIEDGTAVYLMIKPIARWKIALAKILVAAGLTALLIVPSIIITALLLGGDSTTIVGYSVAALVGGSAYAAAFVTLSVFTSRALLLGLAYVLIWEGVLSGLLEGTKFLSIRQATLGLAAALGVDVPGGDPLAPNVSVLVLGVVLVGSFLLASWKLTRFEIRGGD